VLFQNLAIACLCPALTLGGDVQTHEVFRHLTERADGARLTSGLDRVRTGLDHTKQLLGLRARFIGRQAAMLPNVGASRAAILPILRDIGLFAGRERRHAIGARDAIRLTLAGMQLQVTP